jgi:hypothetical protein
MPLTEGQRAFVARFIRRQKLFATLSAIGVAVGLGLALYWAFDGKPSHKLQFIVVLLVLLNARNQLRQWRVAKAFEVLQEKSG